MTESTFGSIETWDKEGDRVLITAFMGEDLVLFRPYNLGWPVRPMHMARVVLSGLSANLQNSACMMPEGNQGIYIRGHEQFEGVITFRDGIAITEPAFRRGKKPIIHLDELLEEGLVLIVLGTA